MIHSVRPDSQRKRPPESHPALDLVLQLHDLLEITVSPVTIMAAQPVVRRDQRNAIVLAVESFGDAVIDVIPRINFRSGDIGRALGWRLQPTASALAVLVSCAGVPVPWTIIRLVATLIHDCDPDDERRPDLSGRILSVYQNEDVDLKPTLAEDVLVQQALVRASAAILDHYAKHGLHEIRDLDVRFASRIWPELPPAVAFGAEHTRSPELLVAAARRMLIERFDVAVAHMNLTTATAMYDKQSRIAQAITDGGLTEQIVFAYTVPFEIVGALVGSVSDQSDCEQTGSSKDPQNAS